MDWKIRRIFSWKDILIPFSSGEKDVLDLTEYGVEIMVDYDQI